MNSSPCSRLALLATVLALFACATVAGAVTVADSTAPEEAAVGEEVTATVELESLYEERDAWTLGAVSELEDTAWTVTEYDESGEEIANYDYDGAADDGVERMSHADVSSDRDPAPARITVEVTGTVPDLEDSSYEEPATFDVLLVGQVWDGGETEIQGWSTRHYTTGDGDSAGSREARSALDDARDAIDGASDDQNVDAAESRWEEAVAAFDEGSFDEAVALAEEAEAQLDGEPAAAQDDGADDEDDAPAEDGGSDETAEDDGSDEGSDDASTDADEDEGSTIVTLLFYLVGLVVLVAVVGGGLYLRQQRQGPGRDPLG